MTTYSYNQDVPAANNNPSDDQQDMLTNAQSINSIIARDHIGFNILHSGVHRQVSLINQAAPGLGEGNGILYANLVAGNSWPFWQNALGSTQLLNSFPTNAALGSSSLPGGLVIQWGRLVTTATLTGVNYLTTLSAAAYSIVLTVERSSSNVDVAYIEPGTSSTVGFVVRRTFSSNLVVNWVSIGPA